MLHSAGDILRVPPWIIYAIDYSVLCVCVCVCVCMCMCVYMMESNVSVGLTKFRVNIFNVG
jgi:hypothetical protein